MSSTNVEGGEPYCARRVLRYWCVTIGLLLLLGLLAYYVLAPILRTRAIVARYKGMCTWTAEQSRGATNGQAILTNSRPISARALRRDVECSRSSIKKLGGCAPAARALSSYVGFPDWLCPNKAVAVVLLSHCGKHPRVSEEQVGKTPDGEPLVAYSIGAGEATKALDVVLSALARCARRSRPEVSAEAVYALGWIGVNNDTAVASLEAVRDSSSSPQYVRDIARNALEEIRKTQE